MLRIDARVQRADRFEIGVYRGPDAAAFLLMRIHLDASEGYHGDGGRTLDARLPHSVVRPLHTRGARCPPTCRTHFADLLMPFSGSS